MTTNLMTNLISFPFRSIPPLPLWMPPVRERPRPRFGTSVGETASVSPQFEVLRGNRTLTVIDDDNLRIGCQSKFSASSLVPVLGGDAVLHLH